MNHQPDMPVTETPPRKVRLDALIQADTASLQQLVHKLSLPKARDLRPAQSGLIMLQGRMGGGGAPFDLGEATIARASVALPTGEEGHGYVLGSDTDKARMIAHLDAAAPRTETGKSPTGRRVPSRA